MLTSIDDNTLSWECLLYDQDGDLLSCGESRQAHISEAVYRSPSVERGASMHLPRCECGAQLFLKADYSLKELWACTLTVRNDYGAIWAYVLRPQHARNLRTHWMLYECGEAPVPPVLPVPPREAIAQASSLGNLDTAYALWFGFATVRRYTEAIGTHKQVLSLHSGKDGYIPWQISPQ